MRALVVLCAAFALVSAVIGAGEADTNLDVFAAASLTEYVKDDLKPAFEREHPGLTVRPNLAASSELRIQIQQGAPADVFMSADAKNMDPLVKARLAEKPMQFARNSLVLIVPKSNPGRIRAIRDLAKPKLRLVVPVPASPIGQYTRTVIQKLDRSGQYGKGFARAVRANVVSEEPNVKGVVSKVQLGEADAGFCYVSDVTPEVRLRVQVLPIPAKLNVEASYPIAVVSRSRQKALAQQFVSFVLSPRGQAMLAAHGLKPAKAARKGAKRDLRGER